MSLRILGVLVGVVVVALVVPALVVGSAITFSFALPVLAIVVAVLVALKVFWDVKLTRDFGANSGMDPRDLIDPDVEKNPESQRQGRRRRE